MRSITDFIQKPSQAVRLMVDGLLEYDQREDFQIDMRTYGSVYNDMCFGCAATCALQKMAGNTPKSHIKTDGLRAAYLDIYPRELANFELAIEWLRSGHLQDFLDMLAHLGITYPKSSDRYYFYRYYFYLKPLTNDTWREVLFEYVKLAKYLESLDM